MALADATWSMV